MSIYEKDLRQNEGVHGESSSGKFDVIIRKIGGSSRHREADVEVRLPNETYSAHLMGFDLPLKILDGLDIIVAPKSCWQGKVRLAFKTDYRLERRMYE